MEIEETIAKARDAITVKRVYGAPYERDGVTVIPAAAIGGGAGGGGGSNPDGSEGGGSGFGLGARPVGAYVIRNGEVRWESATDWTRVILRGQIVAAVLLLALRVRRS